MTEDTLLVANTIAAQLGGTGRLRAFVNGSQFVGGADSLTFRFSGFTRANKCRVTLDWSDTYTVEFFQVRGTDCTLFDSLTNVYAEDLVRVFESSTGLYLHF